MAVTKRLIHTLYECYTHSDGLQRGDGEADGWERTAHCVGLNVRC